METFTVTGKNLEIVLKKIEKQYGPAAKVVSRKQIFLKSPFKKSLTKAIEITGVIDPDGSYRGEGESVDDLNRDVEASKSIEGEEDEEEVPISPITIRRKNSSPQESDDQGDSMVDSKKLMQFHLGLSQELSNTSAGVLDSDENVTPPQSIMVENSEVDPEKEVSPDVLRNAEIRMRAIESMIQSHNTEEEGVPEQETSLEPEEKRHIQMGIALDRPSREDNFRGLESQIPEALHPKGGLEALSQHFSYGDEKVDEVVVHEKKPSEDNPWHIKKLPPETLPEEGSDLSFLESLNAITPSTPVFHTSGEVQESREPFSPIPSDKQTSTVTDTTEDTQSQWSEQQQDPMPEVLQGLVKEIESLRRQLELKTSPRGAILTNISLKKVRELLGDNGFSLAAIEDFIERITHELSPVDIKDYETLQAIIIQWMGEALTFNQEVRNSIAPVVIVVGDSGTGKTSLVAKIAAEYGIRGRGGEPRLTRIASLDTRKVGAKEQIERYGTLMGLLVDVLGSIEEFDRLIDNSPDYRLILIDTPSGITHTKDWVQSIIQRMDALHIPTEVILTLSATMKSEDIASTLKRYQGVGFSSVAITKMDETSTVGNLFSVLRDIDKPISFITDGPKVPGFFKVASASDIMRKLQNFTVSYEESESLAMAAQFRKPLRGISFGRKEDKRDHAHQPTLDFMEPQE